MSFETFSFSGGVTLVGGGAASIGLIEKAMEFAPALVAADGGANGLSAAGITPEAIIGDLDSLEDAQAWRGRLGDRVRHIAEQNSTDFEKCLYSIDAPFFIGVGFLGGRVDHELAALSAMLAEPRPVLLIGEQDVVFAPPQDVTLHLQRGDRVSIMPMRPVRATGAGLKWPLDALPLAPGERVGSSNEATGGPVRLAFDTPGAIIVLDRRRLPQAMRALSLP